jgi:hypothetical protein
MVTYTPTLAPIGVAANTTAEQTFTVTGLVASSVVAVNKPAVQARAHAFAHTVLELCCPFTTGARDVLGVFGDGPACLCLGLPENVPTVCGSLSGRCALMRSAPVPLWAPDNVGLHRRLAVQRYYQHADALVTLIPATANTLWVCPQINITARSSL